MLLIGVVYPKNFVRVTLIGTEIMGGHHYTPPPAMRVVSGTPALRGLSPGDPGSNLGRRTLFRPSGAEKEAISPSRAYFHYRGWCRDVT